MEDAKTDSVNLAVNLAEGAVASPSNGACELLPCPFCGGADIRIDRHPREGTGFHYGEDVFSMCCYQCGATFPNRYRRELLVEAWNRRAK